MIEDPRLDAILAERDGEMAALEQADWFDIAKGLASAIVIVAAILAVCMLAWVSATV